MMELTRQRAVGESRRPSPQKQKEEIEHADLQAFCPHRSWLRRPLHNRRLRRQGRRHRRDGGRVAPSKVRHDASLGGCLRASHGRRSYVWGRRVAGATSAAAATRSLRARTRTDGHRRRLGHGLREIVEELAESFGQLFQSVADRRRLPGVVLLVVGQAVLRGRSIEYRPGAPTGRHRPAKKPSRPDFP